MTDKFGISKTQIQDNILALKDFMKKNGNDAFYISSSDAYLNEYVPLQNSHSYYFTGFKGSTSEVLVPMSGKVILFVDSRYYEQADLEVDSSWVEVEKCPPGVALSQALLDKIKSLNVTCLGLEGDRTALDFELAFSKVTKLKTYDEGELDQVISFASFNPVNPVGVLPEDVCGKSTIDKLSDILKDNQAVFISALDSIAWLTNCRGFQLPYQSTFFSRALALKDKVYLFLDVGNPVCEEVKNVPSLQFEFVSKKGMEARLAEIEKGHMIDVVFYNSGQISSADHRILENIFGTKKLENKKGGLCEFHSIKNPVEQEVIRENFKKADQVIYKTISEIKNMIKKGEKLSELDFYNRTNSNFKESGALDLSFNTISAVGEHSSIVHFSDPSSSHYLQVGNIALLDCGVYYENGYSTDTTRTFFIGDKPVALQKEIYTLVLKGLLNAQSAVFPINTPGSFIDGIARYPMMKKGYNYGHGTGHGVGICVHEGGIGFGSMSASPIKEGQVVSIEPGIYLPGVGGVRLENVVLVKRHEEFEDMLCFEPLVYIGYEPFLIDYNLLTFEEKENLEGYESICRDRGTSFKKE